MAGAGAPLARTALHGLHLELGAKMVPFAGYDMPVQYPMGIISEHTHARAAAALFDVSHMGQARIRGGDAAGALEALVPGDIRGLKAGRMRYTVLTTEAGGILDDIMVTALDDGLALVMNASRKAIDGAHISARLGPGTAFEAEDGQALLALQGPLAAEVLARFAPATASMRFMSAARVAIGGADCLVTRSGYTGEDGFEIAVEDGLATALARTLLAEAEVAPAGLGARDTLRLEAGLCLYGHDIDEDTSPVEAGLAWAIAKRRRADGGFPGAARICAELAQGAARKRVGIRPLGRAPARDGTEILAPGGRPIGAITSGGFGPTVGGPVAMGYVVSAFAAPGTEIVLKVRGRELPARVQRLPFVEHRYFRGKP
ncbi:MAG: glycine cleavage system aminomethyltransferase GcvT [Alphaproteobacteria bacterium]|nr:glycine cleavage system aminomethyltransferase GcvT [Alphaproteobacteria bacterium]